MPWRPGSRQWRQPSPAWVAEASLRPLQVDSTHHLECTGTMACAWTEFAVSSLRLLCPGALGRGSGGNPRPLGLRKQACGRYRLIRRTTSSVLAQWRAPGQSSRVLLETAVPWRPGSRQWRQPSPAWVAEASLRPLQVDSTHHLECTGTMACAWTEFECPPGTGCSISCEGEYACLETRLGAVKWRFTEVVELPSTITT